MHVLHGQPQNSQIDGNNHTHAAIHRSQMQKTISSSFRSAARNRESGGNVTFSLLWVCRWFWPRAIFVRLWRMSCDPAQPVCRQKNGTYYGTYVATKDKKRETSDPPSPSGPASPATPRSRRHSKVPICAQHHGPSEESTGGPWGHRDRTGTTRLLGMHALPFRFVLCFFL